MCGCTESFNVHSTWVLDANQMKQQQEEEKIRKYSEIEAYMNWLEFTFIIVVLTHQPFKTLYQLCWVWNCVFFFFFFFSAVILSSTHSILRWLCSINWMKEKTEAAQPNKNNNNIWSTGMVNRKSVCIIFTLVMGYVCWFGSFCIGKVQEVNAKDIDKLWNKENLLSFSLQQLKTILCVCGSVEKK